MPYYSYSLDLTFYTTQDLRRGKYRGFRFPNSVFPKSNPYTLDVEGSVFYQTQVPPYLLERSSKETVFTKPFKPLTRSNENTKMIRDAGYTSDEYLMNAYLKGAKFKDMDISRIIFNGSDLEEAVFSKCTYEKNRRDDRGIEIKEDHINLDNTNLARSHFMNCNLEGMAFRNADLTDAVFFKCNLEGANFKGANLEGASFKQCKLNHANFINARLLAVELRDMQRTADTVGMLFTDVNLLSYNPWLYAVLNEKGKYPSFIYLGQDSNLTSLWIQDFDLRGVSLKNTTFDDTTIQDCNLQNVSLEGCKDFDELALSGVDLRNVDLSDIEIEKSRIRELVLFTDASKKTELENKGALYCGEKTVFSSFMDKTDRLLEEGMLSFSPSFENQNLKGSDFRNAHINPNRTIVPNFQKANLQEVIINETTKMSSVKFNDADFTNASLENADFANFTDVRLQGANFTNANLQNAQLPRNLLGCTFKGANLKGTVFEEDTIYTDLRLKSHLTKNGVTKSHYFGENSKITDFDNLERSFKFTSFSKKTLKTFRKAALFGDSRIHRLIDQKREGIIQDLNLRNISVEDSIIYGLCFQNCDLRSANVEGTDFEDCVFANCNIEDSNFANCNLKGVVFDESTKAKGAIFKGAFYDDETVFPVSFKVEEFDSLNYHPQRWKGFK